MRQKYDAVTRKRVWGEIKRLMDQGLPGITIADTMAKAGYKMPDAKTNITSAYVGAVMRRLDRDTEIHVNGRPASKQPSKTDRLPATVVGILTDPHLSADQKIRMITAYADL